MGRITVDVNDEWLEAARQVLGTQTKVATINAALHAFAMRRRAVDIIAAFDSVEMDYEPPQHGWSRDLAALEDQARSEDQARLGDEARL